MSCADSDAALRGNVPRPRGLDGDAHGVTTHQAALPRARCDSTPQIACAGRSRLAVQDKRGCWLKKERVNRFSLCCAVRGLREG